jgi:hypothetical protein
MKWLADIASGLISPVTNFFAKKNENKTRIKQQQIQRLMDSDDKEAEWESIQAENSDNSWKDEWITLIITLPIPTIFIAVIISVLLENPLFAEAARAGAMAIKELVPNYAEVLYIVCLAAIGIKAVKK